MQILYVSRIFYYCEVIGMYFVVWYFRKDSIGRECITVEFATCPTWYSKLSIYSAFWDALSASFVKGVIVFTSDFILDIKEPLSTGSIFCTKKVGVELSRLRYLIYLVSWTGGELTRLRYLISFFTVGPPLCSKIHCM